MNRRNQPHRGKPQPVRIVVPDFSDTELVGAKAEKLAKDISMPLGRDGKSRELSTSQLRNFFGEVRNIERILESATDKNGKWNELYPRIKLIKAKAVYNSKRKSGKISQAYKEFLGQCVDKIEADYDSGVEAFGKFCQLFEAVVGYASEYTK